VFLVAILAITFAAGLLSMFLIGFSGNRWPTGEDEIELHRFEYPGHHGRP
jgi:hypothetical protein